MTGLLLKDIKLIGNQKNFIFILVACMFFLAMQDPTFVVWYLTFAGSSFALNSISYDELDNGNTFLFTLPITRKLYVWEKYVFVILSGALAWAAGLAVGVGIGLITGAPLKPDEWGMAAGTAPVLVLLVQSLMIPLELKYGNEKGRTARLMIFAFILAAVFGIGSVAAVGDSNFLSELAARVEAFRPAVLLGCLWGAALVCYLLSMKISERIVEKKEL